MRILDRYGVKATAFVCPGVVDSETPFWWQTVEAAARLSVVTPEGPVGAGEVSRLKTEPDDIRRARVAEIGQALAEQTGRPFSVTQATTQQLLTWQRAGHSIGNHTWDHPILDTTHPVEQIRQIDLAHEWLLDRGFGTDWFAYPNGNWSVVAESRLMQLGYRGAVVFDHRLSTGDHAFRMSRLRVNADDALDEFRSKVAGIHSTLMHLRHRS
jgi:peptidoglycan/xylan/chitin deacetylase (PgdA/CDA1 family)